MPQPLDPRRTLEETQEHAPSVGTGADETKVPSATAKDGAAPRFGPPSQADEIGVLGPYRIVKELGRGGMGAVYAAIDDRLQRNVALKVMLPEFAADQPARERFLREARAAAQISHDNVVTVYEADERDGVPYIAMQFLEGTSLDEYLKKKGSPSLPQILRIAREAATGLTAAHQIGLVHRDVKPANLWLEAPNGRVKVLDFGLARPIEAEVELTQSGAVVGTPAYMSPEQARGLKVDHRTDLFSLGVLLYRLTTGRLPFHGPTTMATLLALATEDPTPVRELNPESPEALASLIHRLLEKNPADRPQSAMDVVKQLRELSNQVTRSSTEPATSQTSSRSGIISASASSDNPFAELAPPFDRDPSSTRVAPLDETQGWRGPPKKPFSFLALAAGFLLPTLVIGIIIIIRSKDGRETKLEVADGAKIAIREKNGTPEVVVELGEKSPTTATEVPKSKPAPAPTIPAADLKAVSWVLANGGLVEMHDSSKVWPGTPMPPSLVAPLKAVTFASLNKLNNAELGLLANCKDPLSIHVRNAPLTDEGLARLKGCRIARLALGKTQVTDAGLTALKDLPNLEHLDLRGATTTDRGMSIIQALPRLKGIALEGSLVNDATVAQVVKAPKLREIQLVDTRITGATLKLIAALPSLNVLRLRGNKIGDAGLKTLEAASKLTRLELVDEAVTASAIRTFHSAVPRCRVLHDGRMVYDGGSDAPAPVADPDRKAAEWALAIGGQVWLNGAENPMAPSSALPVEPFALTGVDVKGSRVTDATLAVLKNCRRLTRLRMTRTRVTDDGIAQLDLPLVSDVMFFGVPITDAVFDSIKDWPIVDLNLTFTDVTDEGVARIKRFRQLQNLALLETKITDAGLEHLRGMNELHKLNLSTQPISVKGIAALKDLPGLQWLNISSTPLDDAAMERVAELRQVLWIVMREMNVTDAGLKRLHAATHLQEIKLSGPKITHHGLDALRAALPGCKILWEGSVAEPSAAAGDPDRKAAEWVLSVGGSVRPPGRSKPTKVAGELPAEAFTLTWVDLSGTKVDDAGMSNLASLKGLTELGLNATQLTDAGLVHLKDVRTLRFLDLGHTSVSGTALVKAENLRSLEEFYLGKTNITDATMAGLSTYSKLKLLNLAQTGVTDVGLDALHPLKGLRQLHLQQTKVTRAGVDRFHAAVPGCRIEYDGGVIEPKN